jgi:EAL domain-containing protein (putative c-di-GMP-specific phosphodiesterase class I)
MLKVDRSFVARLADGARQRRLFASVVGIAHALGLRAGAEGVETREQRGGRSQRV